MKFKKVVALALASVMTMSLAACGSNGDASSAAGSSTPESSAAQSSANTESSAASSDANAGGEAASGNEAVAFPEQLNNGEPCTIRFGWWGGSDQA